MDGIYEEIPASLTFQDWADEIALNQPGCDVVRAVQLGRRMLDRQEQDCLTVEDYTTDGRPDFVAVLGYASLCWVAVAVVASLLILASGWTL